MADGWLKLVAVAQKFCTQDKNKRQQDTYYAYPTDEAKSKILLRHHFAAGQGLCLLTSF
jgi:hypothetical protein